MIRVNRGAEPTSLGTVRATQLAFLTALGAPPTSDDIKGYRVVSDDLWKAQHYKCCYCEFKIPCSFNDVEHYRPKTRANKLPGCSSTHGYWWLAFTWNNLLFACPRCNRSEKNDRFPLHIGAVSLAAQALPPGLEIPLLIDPGSNTNPINHIVFVWEDGNKGSVPKGWWARARNNSLLGFTTIDVCGLNNHELRDLRSDYFDTVIERHIKSLESAIASGQSKDVVREFQRACGLLNPKLPFVAFAYDALTGSVTNAQLYAAIQATWPTADQIA